MEYDILIDKLSHAPKTFLNEIVSKNKFGYFYDKLTESDYISYRKILETNNDLFYMCFSKGEKYIGIHDKKNKTNQMCKWNIFEKNNGIKLGSICGTTSDKYIFATDLYEYKMCLDEISGLSNKFKSEISEANDRSNTFLVLIEFI